MEKIKVLFIQSQRIKKSTKIKTLGDLIEKESPDTYEFINVCSKDNVIEQVTEQKPKIVFLSHKEQKKYANALELVKEIKSQHPSVAIFILLSDMIGDEQELINEFNAAGAYKCYLSTLVLDTLIHDMYVALNLE